MTSSIDRRQFLIVGGATAALTAVATSPLQAKTPRVRVVGLKADYLDRPLGLENLRPRLSWRLESHERNVRQSAYRIRVASSEAALKVGRADLWDSGKTSSRQSIGIRYQGSELTSRQRCFWCVQVWDEKGNPSASEPSWWEMGLLSARDWTAQWLVVDDAAAKADRDMPLYWIWDSTSKEENSRKFRFKFQLPFVSEGGVLYTSGKNGLKRQEQVSGIWIDGKRIELQAPVTDLAGEPIALGPMSAGEHVLAVEVKPKAPAAQSLLSLSDPSPSENAFACFARFDLRNGAFFRIGSAPQWKTHLTPAADWFAEGYDDRQWQAVRASSVEGARPWPMSPAVHLRQEFTIDKPVAQARLYATALGLYEARLNGQRVGDALLAPEVSKYAKRILYRVYDVKEALQGGSNVLGFIVGDGWYAGHPSYPSRYAWGPPPRRVIAQLELTFTDGSKQVIASSPNWRVGRSPILQSELCVGEVYDARVEQPGWDSSGYDANRWEQATLAEVPPGRLAAHVSPPIRATQTLKPQSIAQPAPGSYVFDLGQNFAGWCRLRAKGAAGTRIDLRFGEQLKASGEVDQSVMFGGKAADVFILRGDSAGETLEPRFVYHGFRYVQVSGLPAAPTANTLEGVVIHSDLSLSGRIRVNNPLIQQIWRNTLWTQRSNFVGIPTDCPSREERFGVMGDAGIFWDTAAFNMDVAAFTRRQMDSVRDGQSPEGILPASAPSIPSYDGTLAKDAQPIWADGGVILPWTTWRRYGDFEVIEQNWEAMNRYIQFILDRNPDYVWRNKEKQVIGDWLAPGQKPFYNPDAQPITPNDLICTAYWAHSTDLLAQMAQATGRRADAARLRALFEKIRYAFVTTFVKDNGEVGSDSQTGYILAIKFGLLPDSLNRSAAERLVADIRRRGTALCTGIAGTQFSLDVLVDAGYQDVAYSLLLRTENPSWGYMIAHGATTIWEQWDGNHSGLYFERSHNHPAFGSVGGFLFRRLAGIDAATPGFERIVIRPALDPRVKRGGGDYDSVMGRISTDWEQTPDGGFELKVTLPANTTARVHLPANQDQRITEGSRDISDGQDLRVLSRSTEEVMLEVGSGAYRFVVGE